MLGLMRKSLALMSSSYVKTIPCERLPTFWTMEERQLLVGTTLAPAITSKLKSLQREYDLLRTSASTTRWYSIVASHIDFDDWLQVDAMFRSRALDFHGSCMIPGIDLASHAARERTNAFYEKDEECVTDSHNLLFANQPLQNIFSSATTWTEARAKPRDHDNVW